MFKKLPALLFIVAGLLAVRVSAQTTLTYTITGQFYSGLGYTDDRAQFDGASYSATLSWDTDNVHQIYLLPDTRIVTGSLSITFSNGVHLGSTPVVILGDKNNYGFGDFTRLTAYYDNLEVSTTPGFWAMQTSSTYEPLAGGSPGLQIKQLSINFPSTNGTGVGVLTGVDEVGYTYDQLTPNDGLHGGGVGLASTDYPASGGGFGLGSITGSIAPTAVPEPSTYALLCGSVVLGGVLLRRRFRAAA